MKSEENRVGKRRKKGEEMREERGSEQSLRKHF